MGYAPPSAMAANGGGNVTNQDLPGATPSQYGPSGGMSPGMGAALSGGAMIAGGIFDYMGQEEGARAMLEAAKAAVAQENAANEARQQTYLQGLGKFSPGSSAALTQSSLAGRMGAINPALQAGGKALGMQSASIAGVGQRMMPQQRVDAGRTAQSIEGQRMDTAMQQMGSQMRGIQAGREMNEQLDPARMSLAGFKGEGNRALGRGLTDAGNMGMMYSLNRPAGG